MSSTNPRKRVAPGANPIVPMQQSIQQPFATNNMMGEQMVKWNGGGDGLDAFADATGNGVNSYDLLQNQHQYTQSAATANNSLARRPMNQALVPTTQRANFDTPINWNSFVGDESSLVPQEDGVSEQDNIDALEEQAQKAKREAQGKRKQIPPFVQKLSSFLEEGKNEDLIRWSEKGDSFIVLDEDEFAKTLIPELFKHNNYASFVRQLNMYGFHKRVGLSDNSMRASERKNKSPSEYYNPYFRRGHPNLLWLINKPKGGKATGKKPTKSNEGEVDSDDEGVIEDNIGPGQSLPSTQNNRSLPSTENQSVARKEMAVIRDEINKVREQQKVIARTINRLQQNNQDLYNQAMLFQSQHDRHQNSINAILSFLANLFRKSLEEQGNTQSVSDIISSMIASQGQQSAQQGSVVDLGDFFQNNVDATAALGVGVGGHPQKRARGLLPPIPSQNVAPRPARPAPTGRSQYQNQEMGHITELVDGSPAADTPPNIRQELESNPQERMMRIINDHNANNSSGMDLPQAAEFVASAPNSLDQEQRNKLANFMARQSKSPSVSAPNSVPPAPVAATQPAPQPAPKPKQPKYSPPPADLSAAPSLSPIMKSAAMPQLPMNQISANQEELDQLERLQHQQDQKITELSNMLGPLSPSGRIPPTEDAPETYFDTNHVDFDQYFNFDNHLDDSVTFGGTGSDFNIDFTGGGPPNMASATDHVNAPNGEFSTPSPTGTEEITREDLGQDTRGLKRRRVG
ncbi:unnamed protein product [Clonostachys solani]|uniref:HSF-type DNA-binding domain-containing protein n=1 Tax=Clonostachys solani TaxID=160281 RepID=A0A9P0ETG1_9HYPO|nr:unnamed protein product [Clonostachys solani]